MQRILTLHPAGKAGVNLERTKYEAVRSAIAAELRAVQEIPYRELSHRVEARLGDGFEGSATWYFATVKLDLEARGELHRVPGSRPQRVAAGPGETG
jgi:hypothetical protein